MNWDEFGFEGLTQPQMPALEMRIVQDIDGYQEIHIPPMWDSTIGFDGCSLKYQF